MLRDHCVVKTAAGAGGAQVAQTCGISELARNRGECLELLPNRIGGEQEQEYEIDRPAVDRGEIDRSIQAGQDAERFVQPLNAGMRNRHTAAGAGRSQFLAFAYLRGNPLGRQIELAAARRDNSCNKRALSDVRMLMRVSLGERNALMPMAAPVVANAKRAQCSSCSGARSR